MKQKKLIWLICGIMIFTMLFSACQSSSTSGGDNTGATSAQGSSEDSTEGGPLFKDKLTLKLLTFGRNDFVIGNDMPVLQELERLTNVHLDIELLPTSNPAERFTAAMAAREPFDIVTYQNTAELNKYGMEGVFIPIQDLINEHAPNIKKGLEDPLSNEINPYKMNIFAEITAPDGNIYAVPAISSANAIGPLWAIREDWLKKLSLDPPETMDQLYNVLKAFKQNDPNNNGKDDELPLIADVNASYLSLLPINSGFGAHMFLYVDDTDNTIKYGPVEPAYKEGLAFLNKLFKEGLLDPEYHSIDRAGFNARMANNQAGMMFVWPGGGIGTANAELAKIDPSYQFVPILPMKAPNGKRYKDNSTSGSIVIPRTVITATNQHPVETIKYLDFMFTETGTILAGYGVEGKHYNVVDGQYVVSEEILNSPDGPEAARLKEGVNIQCLPFMLGWDYHFMVMKDSAPQTVAAWTMYREPGTVEAPLPTLQFTDAERDKGPTAMAEIKDYVVSMINPFIKGQEPIDKFDDFVNQIKRMGLDEALKIYNDAYNRYKNLGK